MTIQRVTGILLLYDEESQSQAYMKDLILVFEVPTILSHLFEIPVQKSDVAELNHGLPRL